MTIDLKFLASMPELCDITFLVGSSREPVCGVKAILAARSKIFMKMLYNQPSPQKKREQSGMGENRFKSFLKRSSEPSMSASSSSAATANLQTQGANHKTIIVEEFEPDVFRQMIEYVHTGCVTLQPRTLLGVLNAAEYYGLEDLKKACSSFVSCCITVDTVCPLLSTADRYVHYKCTKSMLQRVLSFVDEHGSDVLNLGSFTLIPKHVVTLILTREELRADEFGKFQAAMMWSKKNCDTMNVDWRPVFKETFLPLIQFHKIPAHIIINEIQPLKVVPTEIIVKALAYQADPTSVELPPLVRHSSQQRSMSCQSSSLKNGSNLSISSTGSSDHTYSGGDGRSSDGRGRLSNDQSGGSGDGRVRSDSGDARIRTSDASSSNGGRVRSSDATTSRYYDQPSTSDGRGRKG